MSVVTAQEGVGLDLMADGLMTRYEQAGVAPPVALYVDCGCCATTEEETRLMTRFGRWPNLKVRLDIWHFMRRLAYHQRTSTLAALHGTRVEKSQGTAAEGPEHCLHRCGKAPDKEGDDPPLQKEDAWRGRHYKDGERTV